MQFAPVFFLFCMAEVFATACNVAKAGGSRDCDGMGRTRTTTAENIRCLMSRRETQLNAHQRAVGIAEFVGGEPHPLGDRQVETA